jgi:hypothetical protein
MSSDGSKQQQNCETQINQTCNYVKSATIYRFIDKEF